MTLTVKMARKRKKIDPNEVRIKSEETSEDNDQQRTEDLVPYEIERLRMYVIGQYMYLNACN